MLTDFVYFICELTEKDTLKFPVMIMGLFISSYNSVSFSFIYFEVQLLGM